MDRPPIGVSPHWFVYNQRMQELTETIYNYLQYIYQHENMLRTKDNYLMIAQWSEELKSLALLEAEINSK